MLLVFLCDSKKELSVQIRAIPLHFFYSFYNLFPPLVMCYNLLIKCKGEKSCLRKSITNSSKKYPKKKFHVTIYKKVEIKFFYTFLNKKLIETYLVYPDNDIYQKNAKLYCRASESGNVELLICRQEWYRFWVPTVLSIIAIITSFLAIFTQNGELWIWLKELLQ